VQIEQFTRPARIWSKAGEDFFNESRHVFERRV
jgi:hypothetical protein